MLIDDGKGTGNQASVSEDNRLNVHALSEPQTTYRADTGEFFILPTPTISLSTIGVDHGIWYLKNENSIKPVYVDLCRLTSSDDVDWKYIKNPTTGTLITSGTDSTPINTKFDSGNEFTGTFKYGAEGLTVTDGDTLLNLVSLSQCAADYDGIFVITPNTSMAIVASPRVACDVAITIGIYHSDNNI